MKVLALLLYLGSTTIKNHDPTSLGMNLKSCKKITKCLVITTLATALLLSTIAISLPHYNSPLNAQKANQPNSKGIGSAQQMQGLAGGNAKIIGNNTSIGNPNAFKNFAKENKITAKTPTSISSLPKTGTGNSTSNMSSSSKKY